MTERTDADDGWPDAGVLCAGLLTALAANGDWSAVADWAGELLVALDRAIGGQVAQILSAPPFAGLEATWRSLELLTTAAETAGSGIVEVQVADLDRADLATALADGWLNRVLYAGPIDTRGGRPVALLVVGSDAEPALSTGQGDVRGLNDVAGRAMCPCIVSGETGTLAPFVFAVGQQTRLRQPWSADPAWAGWFGWMAQPPLDAAAAYAVAAAVIEAVRLTGWPAALAADGSSASAPAALGRLLMAARFAQAVAVRCRDAGGRSPAEVAADAADLLRGRYVGPRLPLRSADVAVARTADGRLSITLHVRPRMSRDDPAEVPVTLTVTLGTP